MIINKKINVTLTSSNMKWYKEKGYNVSHKGDLLEINVMDLMPKSNLKVECICDFCGEKFTRMFHMVNDNMKHTCGNQECKKLLRKEVFMNKYGVENPSYVKEFMQKSAEKFKKNYGKNGEKHKEYVDKRNATNIKKTGNKQGYTKEVKHQQISKMMSTLRKNGREAKCKIGVFAAASKMQVHICELLNGTLNYKFENFIIDIALEEEKIAIEYDGVGHQQYRKNNDKKDELKNNLLLNNNWRIIRISCLESKLLNDDELIKIINEFKNSQYKKCYIDIDNNNIKLK